MVVKKKKIIKKKEIVKKAPIEKKIKIFNKEITKTEYFEYYTLVIFFLFAILFVFILVIFFLAIFGPKYLWVVIPITLGFWGISYYLSKIIFKKSQTKKK
ncbi:MAG TPA: hypothetical protein PK685_03115 [archaeon]|nr:hypothetical protein [archaeon]